MRLHSLALLFLGSTLAPAETIAPLFVTADLDIGESAELTLRDGSTAKVELIDVEEHRGEVWGEIYRSEVAVLINGEQKTLVAGMYRLPLEVGGVQVDSPITGGLKANSHIDHWRLEKDARLRIWPANSPWIRPGSFGYPVSQKWFASQTSFSNEPVAPRPDKRLYYHSGLDIGGAEALTEVLAATDALVVSRGDEVMTQHRLDSPIQQRYDVLYLLDERGWYYRYSHLDSFDETITLGARVKKGQRLGLVGKEGGSGGWTHLHFEIKSRMPSGKWGTQEGYAFIWQACLAERQPGLLAVARPGHVAFAGQQIDFDASKSWSATNSIKTYHWTFPDGSTANGPRAHFTFDNPGTWFSILKIQDADGRIDYDFARTKVFDPANPNQQPPRLHLAYHPTHNLRPLTPITFKVRSFNNTHAKETWDFGDGTPPQTTRSNGTPDSHAADGYAILKHSYAVPGHYLVHVTRRNKHGHLSEDYLHIHIQNPT